MTNSVRPARISYLCLQATREGQASYAHVHEIVDGLKRRGCSVELYEPSYTTGRVPGPLGRAMEFLRVQRRLRASAQAQDALYIRAHFAAYPTAMWAKRRGIPVVQEINGPYEDLFLAWPLTRWFAGLFTGLMRRQYQDADALIAVTAKMADWLEAETGVGSVAVIPNGANIVVFRPGFPKPAGLPERYAIFFGALAPWQGLDTMLAAIDHKSWPNGVSLVILGDGVGRSSVEAAAAANPAVVYLGIRPYHELPKFVASSIVGLVPSRDRAGTGLSPLKTYETLACGVPAIVCDVPGSRELVREASCGIVVPVDDVGALASAVARIAADPSAAAAMGRRGRDAIVASHSWDERAAATLRVIDGVLTRGGRS
ncbi:MAG: glycosyltransferase [Actinomycetia bacterium]|nr:glycosyltransferase [Actinomycetes bacterium]